MKTDWKHLQELIPKVLAGDREAAEEFGLTVFAAFLAHARRRGLREPDDEDAASEALVKVLANLGKYQVREGAGLNSWAYRILNNVINRKLKAARPMVALDDTPEASLGRLDEPIEGAEPSGSAADTSRLHAALGALPSIQQQVLHLKYFADDRGESERTFAAIGQQLGIPESTARVYHHRAIARLRQSLTELDKTA
ncbi:MAG: sigma-70 family RNA polymerase sigma factor [Acidobacteria bacterium]|nr:sigma-70 family RNA polymerase sigma factor [Acidobacteriota bacterium]